MRCHALRSSCFVDSWGVVFPCTIYGRELGRLREVDYDLGRIWNSEAASALQSEIWGYQCPQCWTPCEAYQSIMGNFLRPDQRRAAP
jgi:radical SAM protein with 4Fe4S-binding SPASM domain